MANLKGKTLFAGYDEGSAPTLPLIEDGWFPTGDLAVYKEGALYYRGRKDNLFISGGENLYPEEIERALLSLPNVLLATVIPQEDKEFGSRPIAFIHMEKPLPSQEDFEERLSQFLPKFAIPIKHTPYPKEKLNQFKIKRPEFNCN